MGLNHKMLDEITSIPSLVADGVLAMLERQNLGAHSVRCSMLIGHDGHTVLMTSADDNTFLLHPDEVRRIVGEVTDGLETIVVTTTVDSAERFVETQHVHTDITIEAA